MAGGFRRSQPAGFAGAALRVEGLVRLPGGFAHRRLLRHLRRQPVLPLRRETRQLVHHFVQVA